MQQKVIFLIPGNPYIPGIYDHFVEELQANYTVIVQPHLGQKENERKRYKKISIDNLIQQHEKQMVSKIEELQPEEVIIIGHSLGAEIANKIMLSESLQVDKLIFLFPFLQPALKNRLLIQVLSQKSAIYFLIFFTYILNRSPKKLKKKLLGGLGAGDSIGIVSRVLDNNQNLVKNFLTSLMSYREYFKSSRIEYLNNNLPEDKCVFVYTDFDFWSPIEQISCLKESFQKIKIENVAHNFCVYESQSKKVAGVILKCLNFEF